MAIERKSSARDPERPQTNRLIAEKSPYLLQHAHNPVAWFAWGDEAFAAARRADKPIFLSIGYSTCHWCHVMEQESFEDAEVAALMNEAFVSIKVDREERPDIDQLYMTVCQAMTGSGGWPLTVVLTPDRKPFFAGTYFPRESRFGLPGMLDLIPRIQAAWGERRNDLLATAEQVLAAVRQAPSAAGGEVTDHELQAAYQELANSFDDRRGGFGEAPKFPSPHSLLFLLRYGERHGEPRALEMVERTLRAMRRGGIFDQLGFGFHRYSTDRDWLVPHFEKMLYDQALLMVAYTEAFLVTGSSDYAATVREVAEYVRREMTDPAGGFYTAEDADSEGAEGRYYVWTEEQLRRVLDPESADLARRAYGVSPEGHLRSEDGTAGANVLHLEGTLAPEDVVRLEPVRQALFQARQERTRPHRDDKVLTDWNGLMIAALAMSARALDEPAHARAAMAAADFILRRMRTPAGNLLHRFRDGDAAVSGLLDDYAFLVWGLIELYETTFDASYLGHAVELNRRLVERFWDAEHGGFYLTGPDVLDLPVRRKEVHDGAVPSGNAVAMLNLLRLARLTGEAELEQRAARTARAFSGMVHRYPAGHTMMLVAVDLALGPCQEVVVAGIPGREDTRRLLAPLRRRFLPRLALLLRPTDEESPAITILAPFTVPLRDQGGSAAAYVCRDRHCGMPTTDPEQLLAMVTANE
ncbi:MAG: thioredoxin domain-containing protein [Candidatus Latescibacterota bacterium]|jgi:hypothetical protein